MATFYRVNIFMANNEDLHQAFAFADSTGVPVDLTAASLSMDIETAAENDAVEISTSNGRIVLLSPQQGQFEIQVPATVMRTIPPGVYRHDLLLTRDSRTQRIWEGAITVSRGVTE